MALSRITKIAPGGTNTFAVAFALGYGDEADVTARVGTEVDGTGDPVYRAIDFSTPGFMTVSGATVAAGTQVVFERTESRWTQDVDWTDGANMTAENMNASILQALRLVQEALDGRFEGITQDIDMVNHRLVGLPTPTDTDEAATKEYVDDRVADNNAVAVAAAASAAAAAASEGSASASAGTATTKASEANASAIAAAASASAINLPAPVASTFLKRNAGNTAYSALLAISSADLLFLQSGTGAVTTTVEAKLRGFRNVTDFGALVDNSTNDTAAVVAAIAAASAAGGGVVYFPAGVCRVTSLGNLPANVVLKGAGRALSKIRTTSATLDVVSINGANANVQDIGFDATVTRTAGAFINITTNASTIDLSYINMVGAFRGIVIPSVALINLRHIDILDTVATTGVSINVSGGFALIFDNVICRNNAAARPFAHLNITRVEDLMVSNSQFISGINNLNMAPGNGQAIGLFRSTNTQYDDASGPSIRIAPTGTGKVNEVVIDGVWIKGVTQDVLITNAGGGTVNSVDIINCLLTGTDNGIEATGVGNIGIKNCKIGGHAIGVALSNVAKGLVHGNVIAPHGLYGANTTGVFLGGTTDGVIVSDNNLSGNTTAVSYSASGTKNRLVNNHGYNDANTSASVTVTASPFTVPVKPYPRTVYVNAGAVSLISINAAGALQANLPSNTTINQAVHLAPNSAMAITYSSAPTVLEAIC